MKLTLIGAGVAAASLTVGAFYARRGPESAEINTGLVTRGDIVETVVATGALEAVTTVQVGAQLSGTVASLSADFNSIVHKGDVIARLEPSLYQSQVEQARANLDRAVAEVDRLRVASQDAATRLARARELSARQLIPATELETAEVAVRLADAQNRSAEAQVTQARASLNQAEVNLQKTIVTAPIDGFVVARNVDVGQTVAASLQAPTLFVIAADLTRMQVNAGIDESDVGRVRAGQPVTFTVDAYPGREFTGTVAQVRLSPTVLQNVVTYATVISVPNKALELKPGMTATASIETERRRDVLRVPNSALRFSLTPEVSAALGIASGPGTAGAKRANGAGRVWVEGESGIAARDVRIGFSNGALTELVSPDLSEGTEVVTSVTLPQARAAATGTSPLLSMTPGAGRGGGPGNAPRRTN